MKQINNKKIKAILLLVMMITCSPSLHAQLINCNPDPNGEPWWAGSVPETALKSLLPLEASAGNNYEELQQYYLENDVIANDSVLSPLASSLANKCDEEMQNYPEAIAWYENVITDPKSSFNDSIFATIDLGNLYLRMEDNGAKGIQGRLTQFVPKSYKDYQEQTDYALSLLPQIDKYQDDVVIPNIAKSEVEYSSTSYIYEWNGFEIETRPQTLFKVKFEGDTIIGDYEYVNVHQKDWYNNPYLTIDGYVREDDSGKVFILYEDTEYLLYDFGMQVGDSVRMPWANVIWDISPEYETYVRLDSITEEFIGGATRKCYHVTSWYYDGFYDDWEFPVTWVEGIGSLWSPLYSVWVGKPGCAEQDLLCYKENGELVYINEDFNDCHYGFEDPLAIEENHITNVSVYPNPGENVLNIQTSLQNARVEVYDILGKIVYEQEITGDIISISTDKWSKGMYLWRVFSNEQEIENGKWIKQ